MIQCKRFFKVATITVIALFLGAMSLKAQSGTVTGVVTDAQTGESLVGANVIFSQNSSIGASTNIDGEFTIRNAPVGTDTLVARYVGYDQVRKVVSLEDNQEITVNFKLKPQGVTGEEVVVSAQREGQVQAINQQLASDNIVNVVSEAKISEMPDFNAAQSIGRLPGVSTQKSAGEANKVVIRGLAPKYNSVEVEGIKLASTGSTQIGVSSLPNTGSGRISNDRSVDLSMVTPYMIETISVYKSLTPDMNANSIGGTVNMDLRTAPDERRVTAMWQQGYTNKSNTVGNYRAVISGSDRFFEDKLGIYVLANMESYDRNADNLSAGYNVVSSEIDPELGYPPVKVGNVSLNRHQETRNRYGANVILDYKLPNGAIQAINMYTRMNSDYTDYNQEFDYSAGFINWSLESGENNIDQQLHSLMFDYDLGFMSMDLSASYNTSINNLDDSPQFNLNQTQGVQTSGVKENVKPDSLNYLVNYDRGDAFLRNGTLFNSRYQEEKFTFKGDFKIPYNLGSGFSGFIKFGGQYDDQENTNDQNTPYVAFNGADESANSIQAEMMRSLRDNYDVQFDDATGLFPASEFRASNQDLYDSFLNDKYGQVYYAAQENLLTDMLYHLRNTPRFSADSTTASDPGGWFEGPYQELANDYEYNEDYYAGYLMAKAEFLNFMFIGGVRYERVESEYMAYNGRDRRNPRTQEMYPTTADRSNEYLLPMGQIKYSPLNWLDLRYSFTKTLARPDFSQLSPKYTVTQGNNIFTGNTELDPGVSYNHDATLSISTNKIGLLSISGFYKTVEDFSFDTSYELTEQVEEAGIDSMSNYPLTVQPNPTVYTTINNPFDATIKGFEVDLQTNMWYLPRPMNNIVLGINYSRIISDTRYRYFDQKTVLDGRERRTVFIDSSRSGRMISQPEHIVNSYIGFDYKGLSTRLSFNYESDAVNSIGRFPVQDGITREYFSIDFSARQKLPFGFANSEVFLDVTNLNQETNESEQRSINGFTNINDYGLTANLGLRLRFQ